MRGPERAVTGLPAGRPPDRAPARAPASVGPETSLKDLPLAWIHDRWLSRRRRLESLGPDDPDWAAAGRSVIALEREMRRRQAAYGWWNVGAEALRAAAHRTRDPGVLEDMAFRFATADGGEVGRGVLGLELESRVWTTDLLRRAAAQASDRGVAEAYERELLLRLRVLEHLRRTGALSDYHHRLGTGGGFYRARQSRELRRSGAGELIRAGLPRALVPSRTDDLAREAFIAHRQERIAELLAEGLGDSVLRAVTTACREVLDASTRPLAIGGRPALDRRIRALESALHGSKGYRRALTSDRLRSLRRRAAAFGFLGEPVGLTTASALAADPQAAKTPAAKTPAAKTQGFSTRLAKAQGAAARASALAHLCSAREHGPDRSARLRALARACEQLDAVPEVLDALPDREVVLRVRDSARALGLDPSSPGHGKNDPESEVSP